MSSSPGQTTTLHPGAQGHRTRIADYTITLRDGRKAGIVNTAVGKMALPAGDYLRGAGAAFHSSSKRDRKSRSSCSDIDGAFACRHVTA
jgi:hypothetical protein